MRMRLALCLAAAVCVAAGWSVAAYAEVVSVQGTVTSTIYTTLSGVPGTPVTHTESYPGTQDTLPIQVITRVVDPNERAAALIAAQFADPRTATGPDPDEFAIDFALSTLDSNVFDTGQGTAEEVRVIRFTPAELGTAAGETVKIAGRMYLDGALSVFAGTQTTDLTHVSVALHVTITSELQGQQAQTVFSGSFTATGGPNRSVTLSAAGDLPTTGVFDADLSAVDPQLSVFRVFVFPSMQLSYTFDAIVDQPLTLRAKVTIDGANIGGQSGVAAVIGTPLSALQDVITATQGQQTAAKMSTALAQERAKPTGTDAFAALNASTTPFLSWCGLLGFESLLGLVGLLGLKFGYRRVHRSR
jgi:hypothetical protein